MPPTFALEQSYGGIIAGIDEAGRGPWAGPVVASAVILDAGNIPAGLNDSKQLSAAKREALFAQIMASSQVGIGMASVEEIDRLNILAATKLAMVRAFEALQTPPHVALVDGNQPPTLTCKTVSVVGGDAKSLSIAAASIIAKVTRDRIMCDLAREFPYYGWEKNAGYGTALHQAGLAKMGICEHHRKSYKPIKAYLTHVA